MAFEFAPRRPARRVFAYWRSEQRTLRQGFVALLISSGGDLLAGLALSFMSHRLDLLPGLFVLIPAAIGMRGNIFGALGSRLGTGIHAGLFRVSRRRQDFLPQNVYASFILTLATSLFLGFVARLASAAFTHRSISVWDFVTISILGGIIGSVVVGSATVYVSVLSQRRGWDLDSVSAPLVTAIGDTCTLPALWAASLLVLPPGKAGSNHLVTLVVGAAGAAVCLVFLVRGMLTDLPLARHVIHESMIILFVAGCIDILAGTAIESRAQTFFVRFPALLVLLPAFLEDTGALGGILSSRLSSKLHMGLIEPRRVPQPLALLDASLNFLFAVSVFTLVALSAQLISMATGKVGPGVVSMLAISLFAGFLATVISSAIAYYGAVATFRFGWDPDNFGIPLVTSFMDLAGTVCLIVATVLFVGAGRG
jgi:mgtE-like transporter